MKLISYIRLVHPFGIRYRFIYIQTPAHIDHYRQGKILAPNFTGWSGAGWGGVEGITLTPAIGRERREERPLYTEYCFLMQSSLGSNGPQGPQQYLLRLDAATLARASSKLVKPNALTGQSRCLDWVI